MLLIWDIHANAKHIQAILTNIREFVKAHDDEKNVIFLGDYMYMFSYDRSALSELFDIFLEIRHSGKNVYILTGNHDRLAQHYIYQEWKKVADILNTQSTSTLQFITEPTEYTIEWQKILFMPYNKAFLAKYLQEKYEAGHYIEWENQWALRWNENPLFSESTTPTTQSSTDVLWNNLSPKATIFRDSLILCGSNNTNEQLSWALNMYLADHYEAGTTLIHHYYTADTRFPGQDAQFDYKDIALHSLRPQYADRVISGHIHKSFLYKNYLCTGSIWYTTSGERDHCKWLWQWDTTAQEYKAREVAINPYYKIQSDEIVDTEKVYQHIKQIREEHKAIFAAWNSTLITRSHDVEPNLATITLLLYTTQSVENIQDTLAPELKNSIGDIQLKQLSSAQKDMTDLLDISQYNIQQSLLDWKELVKKYLMSRYWTESDKYRTLLSELDIL